jgi:uncharacterized protein (TIGR03086 family)
MSAYADNWRDVAAEFTRRAEAVPAGAWDQSAPCEGWVARDIVRHMVEWMPWMVLTSVGVTPPEFPSVDVDPLGAWLALDRAIQSALDDPEIAQREFENQVGRFSVEKGVDMFCTGDVFLHTWDLARATGGDERLDPQRVHDALVGMEPLDEVLRQSGQFGPRVEVPDDADEQTKLIAFIGRQP